MLLLDINTIKSQAKSLKKSLMEDGIQLSHSACLNTIARIHGYNNFETASARLGQVDNNAGRLCILIERKEEHIEPPDYEGLGGGYFCNYRFETYFVQKKQYASGVVQLGPDDPDVITEGTFSHTDDIARSRQELIYKHMVNSHLDERQSVGSVSEPQDNPWVTLMRVKRNVPYAELMSQIPEPTRKAFEKLFSVVRLVTRDSYEIEAELDGLSYEGEFLCAKYKSGNIHEAGDWY